MGKADNSLQHIDIKAMRDGAQLSMEYKEYLVAHLTKHKIVQVLQGIRDLKVPGIDGHGARFFKASWHTIKDDVIAPIMEFFDNERLYKAFSSTVVTLIPKNEEEKQVKDYRPIAGYQHIYDHILLAYELIKGYYRKGGGLRFNINGEYSEILQAKRGIRQGDPMSPLLFVIMMEYLNKTMHKMQRNYGFNHQCKCEKLFIINLTFADDVLMFSRGDQKLVELMLEAFNKISIRRP
ncbi:uncharacterized protein LOC127136103 [Lathyrus oleraceus]|uniref:uncharacterized protein LOC127136103 n=1 Tax=Pisum sativum TaxID=3888 RepID=UPI0021D1DD05|nr:uncharacterized protein LOC127136103 [Pisum sativum]